MSKASEAVEEFVEITGDADGDFPDTWSFDDGNDLIGTFTGTEVKKIKGDDRTIHSFEVDDVPYNAWGAALLDSRLKDVEPGTRVKIVKTGDKITTGSGRKAWEFKVFASTGAIR
jgi:hypothetical protein